MNSITKNKILKACFGLLSAAVCFSIWQIAAMAIDNSYFLPTVPETFSALLSLFAIDRFPLYILISLGRVGLGLVIGVLAGIILGAASYLIPFMHSFVSPIISVMKATPIAAIILILWFTFTDTSLAVVVVVLMITPIIWQNIYDGFKSISQDMKEVALVYEMGFFKRLRYLVIPALMKYLIPAVITSVGLSWKAEIASEIMTYSNIGRSIQDFKSLSYDTASVYAWALVIVAVSIVLESVTKYFLRRIRL